MSLKRSRIEVPLASRGSRGYWTCQQNILNAKCVHHTTDTEEVKGIRYPTLAECNGACVPIPEDMSRLVFSFLPRKNVAASSRAASSFVPRYYLMLEQTTKSIINNIKRLSDAKISDLEKVAIVNTVCGAIQSYRDPLYSQAVIEVLFDTWDDNWSLANSTHYLQVLKCILLNPNWVIPGEIAKDIIIHYLDEAPEHKEKIGQVVNLIENGLLRGASLNIIKDLIEVLAASNEDYDRVYDPVLRILSTLVSPDVLAESDATHRASGH